MGTRQKFCKNVSSLTFALYQIFPLNIFRQINIESMYFNFLKKKSLFIVSFMALQLSTDRVGWFCDARGSFGAKLSLLPFHWKPLTLSLLWTELYFFAFYSSNREKDSAFIELPNCASSSVTSFNVISKASITKHFKLFVFRFTWI